MLFEALRWWIVVSLIGLIALPIVLVLFRSLPGQGIAFAKPLGLLLMGYLFWLAVSLDVLPNRPGSAAWVLIALLAIDIVLVRWRGAELRDALMQHWRLIVAVEVVFFVAFFTAGHIKSFIPEIQATEKPMDFMLLNTAARSASYPPDDPWLSGFSVSYYYFGYVIHSVVGRLAAVPMSVAFNLGLVSTAALAAVAAFGLGYEMVSAVRRATFRAAVGVGIGAVLLVTVMGNLQGVLEFAAANGVLPDHIERTVNIANLDRAGESDACLTPVVCVAYPTEESDFWWWWRATRISPEADTITEFPFFSFILGDLHPHVMAIPFVLTAFGLALVYWRREGGLSLRTWRSAPGLLAVSAVLVGGLAFMNTWDLPTFGFLIALLVLARNLITAGAGRRAATDTLGFLVPLFGLGLLLYLPFYLSFSSQAGFVDAVQGSATRPIEAFLFWAPLFVVALPLPFYLVFRTNYAGRSRELVRAAMLPLGLVTGWLLLLLVRHDAGTMLDAIADRGWNWLTAIAFGAGLAIVTLALWRLVFRRDGDETDTEIETADDPNAALLPVLAATATAMLLIYGAEFFFITDVFGTRLNTVFKLYYQAWLLLGVSGAASAWLLLHRTKAEPSTPKLRLPAFAVGGIAALLIAGAMLYPLGATLSRTEGLARGPRTLDGLAYTFEGRLIGDYTLVNWLRNNADPADTLVEGIGGSYTLAGRISSRSGVPAVLGWRGHQRQWGRDEAVLSERNAAVDEAYSTPSLEEAVAILRQYGVTYVVVGDFERQTYPAEGLEKFETGLPAVVRSVGTALYRLPLPEVEAVETSSEVSP